MQQSVEREYRFGRFRFVTPDGALFRGAEPVALKPKTADLLLIFLEEAGKLLSKDRLIDCVWDDAEVSEGNLTFQIHALRQALGDTAEDPKYIATVPKRGYRFIAEVTEHPSSDTRDELSPVAPPDREPPIPPLDAVPTQDGAQSDRITMTARKAMVLTGATIVLLAGALGWNLVPSTPLRIEGVRPLTRDSSIKQPPLLSDGVRIYLTTTIRARTGWIPIDGGESNLLSALKDLTPLDVSAVRSEFLAITKAHGGIPREVWAVPTMGLTPRRLGSLLCDHGAWSPTGESIACASGNTLIVADGEGQRQRRIASLPATVETPRWSPDGRRLRFDVNVVIGGLPSTSIWEVREDGTDLHEVLSGANNGGVCCGKWTPDGRWFIFQAPRNGPSQVWALQEVRGVFGRPRRADPIRLTQGELSFSHPLPSNDGRVIYAFGEPKHRGELVKFDATSRRFVPYLGGISATWVTFSSDGKLVAYVSYPENILWCARADGSEKRQLTFPPTEVAGLAWAPDSKRIAFRAGAPGKRKKIFVIAATGGMAEPLVPGDVEQGIPGWSHDGRQLVFGDVPEAFGNPTGIEVLHLFDLERRTMSTLPGSKGLWTSRWSPDGRYISALTISLLDMQTLRLFDVKSQQWRTLSANHVNNPTWSADSRYIYYHTENNLHSLRRVRVSDGQVEEITDLETYPLADYGWSGLAPDGSPLILRQRYDVQVYALMLAKR